jgi:hypothetical protein
MIDTHFYLLPKIIKDHIKRHGKKGRYTIYLLENQITIYSTGQKLIDGELYFLKKESGEDE